MDFTTFTQKVARQVQEQLGSKAQVEINCVRKNNGIMLSGISIIQPGINISPTIYLNDFYEHYLNGTSLRQIAGQVTGIYEQAKLEKSMDMEFFTDYEKIKGRLTCRLVNYERNREWLKDIPHIPYLDMALTFQCLLRSSPTGNAAIQITREHCRIWNIEESGLYRQAMRNTQELLRPAITGMQEVVLEMVSDTLREEIKRGQTADFPKEPDEEWIARTAGQMVQAYQCGSLDTPMFVMTNQEKLNGAAVLLYDGVLRQFAQEKKCNFFILPSSVHEVILIPDSGKEKPAALKHMVCEVNETQLEGEEFLSDSVYYYDRAADRITVCA